MSAQLSAADVIATSSVVVALLALFATFWQAWLAYRHNRLSVRPHLVWHISRTNDPQSCRMAVSVKNLGLGPAIIRERYFVKSGEKFIPKDLKTDEVPNFIALALGQGLEYKLRTFGLPGTDAAIPSQGEVVIADIEFPGAGPEELMRIVEGAGKLAFHVRYESMYGEKFDLHAT